MKKILFALFLCAGFTTNTFAQAPVANFSGNPTTVCAGRPVAWTNLSTGNGNTYVWSFPGATGSQFGGNPNSSNATTPGWRSYNNPGVYDVTLVATNGNGNDTEVKTGYITVLAAPTVLVSPAAGFLGCGVTSTTLTASGANTYTWSPATALNTTSGAIVIASPTVNVLYTVTGTNASGCTDQQTVAVSVNNTPPATPTGLNGPTTVCSGQSGVVYTVNGGINPPPIRTWTVPPGATITAGQGTRSVTITFGSASGNVCCTASNACGASTAVCQAVNVNPTPAVGSVGTITGPATACDNQTGIIYTVSPIANALAYNWNVNNGATITSGQGTNTITVTFATNNVNVCVTASNSCNTSLPSCMTVTVSPNTPAIPGAITGPTTVCSGQTGVAYSIANVPNATVYTWTVPSGATITSGQGTNAIIVTYASTSGTVCVTSGNGCGTSLPNCTNITVDPTPAVGIAGTITGPSAVCANQSGIAYSIAAVANATSYNWTLPAGATITTGAGTNAITVTFGTNAGNVCVSASNSCNTSSPSCKAVTVDPNTPAIPGGITGPTTVCTGQAGVVYSVASVPNTTLYSWSVPSGATITAGQGTRFVTVTFASASGTVCVTAGNACGTSLPNCQLITVDPTTAVGTVGAISGPLSVCANQAGIGYSIAAVSGASSYTWTVPGGATITSGQGTTAIAVTFGPGAAGNVCVFASNICSSSPQNCVAVSVDPNAPAIPGGITGLTTVCSGQVNEDYTIANVPNASVYTWAVPTGATITAGQGTNSITVTFGSTTGTVCVTAGNACGTSFPNCQNITVDPNPMIGPVGAISGLTAVCANQSNIIYSIPSVTGATTYSWTVPAGSSITAGQGTATITVTAGSTAGNVCVVASNSCSSSPLTCLAVSVASTAPAIPAGITGLTTVCSGQAGEVYTIAPVANASVYTWTVPTGASITGGQGTTSITVTFGSTTGTVCVTAGNACGVSLPNCLIVTVDPTPAVGSIGTIVGSNVACTNQTNAIYSIPAVANASSYAWTVPTAATITAGQGTNTITVTFGNVSGNICVIASNSCGASPQSCMAITVSPTAPAIPTGFAGSTTVCSSQVGSYSISPVANATSYTWTVPTGATVTSGQGTTNVVVTFGGTSGNICVSAANGCGASLQNCQAITVSSSVLTVSVTNTPASCSTCCDGSATATPGGGTPGYTYSWFPSGGASATATGLCVGTYTVCITDAAGCMTCSSVTISTPIGISELTDNGTIKVFPNPANDHIFIEGTLSSAANLQISIVNMFGQKMINELVYADRAFSQQVNIQRIPSGVYFIEIRSGEMVRNSKIIKIQ